MLRRFSISSRITTVTILLLLCTPLSITAFLYIQKNIAELFSETTEALLLEEGKEKIQIAVDTLAETLAYMVKDVPDAKDRHALLQAAIKNVRFGDDQSGYFFVFDGTIVVALPVNEALVGTDMGSSVDPKGVYFVRDLYKAASAGGGFVHYTYQKPGKGLQPKLSYAVPLPGTSYWVGTGVYIDNIETTGAHVQDTIHEAVSGQLLVLTFGAAVILLFFILPLSILTITSIIKPLHITTATAQQIAQGNLDVKIHVTGNDEISVLQNALNHMVEALAATFEDVKIKEAEAHKQAEVAREASEQTKEAMARAEAATREGMLAAAKHLENVVAAITEATNDLSAQSEEISRSTGEQMHRIQETATAMEEMNITVMEVAKNASDAADQTNNSRERALEGASVVTSTKQAMEELTGLANNLKNDMHKLGQRSDSIGQVISVINDIADQTNLLALNAAIEAARAGDAGRGFAVVADEVRKLAEKTMTATKEVGASIHAIQELTRTNVEAMEYASNAINNTASLSASSGEILQEIVHMAQEVAGQVQSIATAAEEQSATSEEIARSVEQANMLAQTNGRMTQQSEQHIVYLVEQTKVLHGLMDKLMR